MGGYLTIKETAIVMGVTPQTLRNWEKKGILVPERNPTNSYRLYRVGDIEHFIEKSRNEKLEKHKMRVEIRILRV
jgi:DNA-binding transcriptional MerR regulator